MSENLPKHNSSEEVDLGQLFNAIGNLFDRFIKFIGFILKSILSFIVVGLRALIDNFKLIAITMLVLGVIGYALQKSKTNVYSSGMLVKPYYDSKYQLITNINYYNALIGNEDYKALSRIFQMEEDSIKLVKSFEIKLAPETENDRILDYERFIKSIDSARAVAITYDDYIENRSVFSGEFFEIVAESYKKDIFKSLSVGLNSAFTNEYSRNKKRKRDSLNFLQKQNLMASLEEIKKLQEIYIGIIEKESEAPSTKISLGDGFSFDKDKSNTREFELLNKEIKLTEDLRKLEEQKVQENVFFDVISDFQEVGNKSSKITELYVLIFPALGFIMLCLFFLLNKSVKFIKNYEA